MRKVFLFMLISVFLSCTDNVRKGVRYTSHSSKRVETLSCDDKLRKLILSCQNFNTLFDKESICAELSEEIESGIYSIRLFEYGTGEEATSTQGWITLNVNNASLKDITIDPDSPVDLEYDSTLFQQYVKDCLGKGKVESEKKELSTYWEGLPSLQLPFVYSYDFILDMPGTQKVDESLYPSLASFEDEETELKDCRIAKMTIPSTYNFFVLFAHDKKGEGRFFLCSLNEKYELMDKLLIYSSKSIKWNNGVENCYIDYLVDKQYGIILKETITLPDSVIVMKERQYHINKGKFVLTKERNGMN